jgi:AAA+ superfamily predicted ATPase
MKQIIAELAPPRGAMHARALLAELARLDRRLEAAVAAMEAGRPASAETDPYRGLYVTPDEAAALAARAAGAPAPYAPAPVDDAGGDEDTRWARLRRDAGLTGVDAAILLVALAPELELKYERLYGYLQDDVTRRRPTVDLALQLVAPGWDERVAARARLAPSAPLLRHGLLRLVDDPAQREPPLLSRYLKPDPRVVDHLLGLDEPDPALRGVARVVEPAVGLDEVILPAELKATLARLAGAAGHSALVYLQGPYGVGKRTTAEALCREAGAALVVADAARLAAGEAPEAAVAAVGREALLRGATVLWEGFDALLADERAALRDAVLREAEGRGVTFLAGEAPWEPADAPPGQAFYRVALGRPAHPERVRLWGAHLNGDGHAVDVEALAGRFRFSGGQIRDAAATARALARVRDPGGALSMDDLFAACRLQSNPRLASLAQKVAPHHGWSDIVLPPDRQQQLREIVNSMKHRALVMHEWGFGRKLAMGKGLNALFAGPPGTGKTMAAGILARELGLDLYRIDLSTVVSKYIGETEKNLARIFTEAETSHAILFFDEADAMFGKRTEVRDSHDRYANLEVSYLLQRMEEYEGVVVLATNFRKNLDEAFVRRMQFTVDFPFPGERERLRIWEGVFPEALPREPGVQLEPLARRLELAGGNIRNVALAAAFLAADEGGLLGMRHLVRAARREYQKMGKVVSDREFDELAAPA